MLGVEQIDIKLRAVYLPTIHQGKSQLLAPNSSISL
jgi:hypothetical protein